MAASGQRHMAIDNWLFQQHCAARHPATLRFYTWSPVAISLGYHQRRYPTHWDNLRWQDRPVDLVRRPTGGRAVLHQGDLTYAVVVSGLSGNRRQGYEAICRFLIAGWQRLGVSLSYGTAQRSEGPSPNCFATATTADLITPSGEKLIGSAQRRDRNTVLQHGSMRLIPDPALFQAIFGPDSTPAPLGQPLLPQALGQLSPDQLHHQVMDALVTAAAATFQADFVVAPLSPEEIDRALAAAH
ncbi:MAG: biotin/lipoate A/B protein ligase family protein [Cyanobacteria bacterium P01_A01_bin.105]